jgi:hypothetical protein
MDLHETYCSVKFLERLYSQLRRDVQSSDEDISETEHLQSLNKLIHRYSDLILDLPEQEIIDRSLKQDHPFFNPNLKKLWKEGRQKFVSFPETFEQLKTDEEYFKGKTTELYFIDGINKFCTEIGDNNGIQCLNFSQFPEKEESMFEFAVFKTEANEYYPLWDSLKNICPPSNSMIIVDQYLKTESQSLGLNLFPLLAGLLPEKLSIPYHLAILVSEESNQNLTTFHKELSEYLTENYSYEFELTILQTRKKKIHDRNILTNSYWINSGYGFDLVREKNSRLYFRRSTTIHFYPITCIQRKTNTKEGELSKGTILADWIELVKMYKTIIKSILPRADKTINVVGSGIHRLLKM